MTQIKITQIKNLGLANRLIICKYFQLLWHNHFFRVKEGSF